MIQQAKKYIESGLSVIIAKEDKKPISYYENNEFSHSWEKYQNELIDVNYLESRLKPYHNLALVAGKVSGNIECLDIDAKYFDNKISYEDFKKLIPNDLLSKITIAQTPSKGYHYVYKCSVIEGSKKLATRKDPENEKGRLVLFETKGEGGYFLVEPSNNYQIIQGSLLDIKEITPEERLVLLDIARSFHRPEYVEPRRVQKVTKTYENNGKTPIEDFKEQADMFTLLESYGWTETNSRFKDKTQVLRPNAKSKSSGYIFHENDCLYVFSTSTPLPSEKLLNVFDVFCELEHNGDVSAAMSDLYYKGYGDRAKLRKTVINIEEPKIDPIDFPVAVFPENLRNFMLQSEQDLGLNIDYMASSFLWVMSLLIGNTFKLKVKNGWVEAPILWIAIVSSAGTKKSPSMDHIVSPMQKINKELLLEFKKKLENWEETEKRNADLKRGEQKEDNPKPKVTQRIIQAATLEAVIDVHSRSPRGLGLYMDELKGWVDNMARYSNGSDEPWWLSSFNNKFSTRNTKTDGVTFIDNPFIPILGGIQPDLLRDITHGKRKDNGFSDRILLCNSSKPASEFSFSEMPQKSIDWYNDFIYEMNIFIKNHDYDNHNFILELSEDSKEAFRDFMIDLDKMQKSESENEYVKSIYPKMQTYLGRLALIFDILYWFYDEKDVDRFQVQKRSVLAAIDTIKYFINSAKKIKQDSEAKTELIEALKSCKSSKKGDKIQFLIDKNMITDKSSIQEIANAVDCSGDLVRKVIKNQKK